MSDDGRRGPIKPSKAGLGGFCPKRAKVVEAILARLDAAAHSLPVADLKPNAEHEPEETSHPALPRHTLMISPRN